MADVTKTAELLITGNARSANAAMQSVGMAAGAMSAAVVGALGTAAMKAAEFEEALAEVNTMAQGADMGAMGAGIEDLARKYGKGAEDMARGAYDILSSGVAAADTVKYLDTVGKLSVAGRVNAATATDLLTTSTNAWKDASGGAAHTADVLFATVGAGKTRISELAPVMGQVANQAYAMGISMEETYAAVATLTAQGVPTAQAVTYIRGALTSVLKPSQEAADAAAALGIQFDATALRSQGLAGFLQTVYEKTGGNVEQMGELFGSVEGLNAVLALVGADGGAKFVENIDKVKNSAGAADTAFATMSDTMSFRTAQVKEELNAAWRSVGEAVFPLVETLSEKVSILAGWLGDVAESDAGRKMITIGGEIAGALGVIGGALYVLPKLKEGLGDAVTAGKATVKFFKSDWGVVTGALTGILLLVQKLRDMGRDAKANFDKLSGKGGLGPREGETPQQAAYREGREQLTEQISELEDKRAKWRGIRDMLQTFGVTNKDLLERIGGWGEVRRWDDEYRKWGLTADAMRDQRKRLNEMHGGMAGGGFITPGMVTRVGEAGEEIAIGTPRGTMIVPLTGTMSGAQSFVSGMGGVMLRPPAQSMDQRVWESGARRVVDAEREELRDAERASRRRQRQAARIDGDWEDVFDARQRMVRELGRIEQGGFENLHQTTQSYLNLYNNAATRQEKRAAADVMAQELIPAFIAAGNAVPGGFGGQRDQWVAFDSGARESPRFAETLREQERQLDLARERKRARPIMGYGAGGPDTGVQEGALGIYGEGMPGSEMTVKHVHTFQDGVVAVQAQDLVEKTIVEGRKRGRSESLPY